MSTVLHGPREGLPNISQASNLLNLGISFNGKGIDSKKAIIIQQEDWDKIKASVTKFNADSEKFAIQEKEREELHAKSKDLVKTWSNTIKGQRLKKIEEKKLRDEQEEFKKQQIDIEEEKFKAQQRKEAIAQAKQQQFFQIDRVKKFHGALLLTEVLKERDAQIEMKLIKQEWQKKRNEHVLEMEKKSIEEAIKKEEKQAAIRLKRDLSIAEFQLLQIKDKQEILKQEKEKGLEERGTLKQQYDEFESTNQANKLAQSQFKTLLCDEYKKEILLKKMQEEQEKLRSELEDKKIENYVKVKRKISSIGRKKEQDLLAANEKSREKMNIKLQEIMRQRVDNEDMRFLRAVKEQEQQRLEKELENGTKNKEIVKSIKLHREHVLAEAKKNSEEIKSKDKKELQQRIEEDYNFHNSIELSKLNQRSKLSTLRGYQKCQMTEKVAKQASESESDENLKIDKKYNELLINEEKVFQDYAQKVIKDAKSSGRNPFILIKAANEGSGGGRGPKFDASSGLRPSYIVADATGVQLPHYLKDANIYNHSYGHVGISGKRLGFTW